MKRYIDADKLAKLASNSTNGLTANDIMRFPREDVAPVKHAHWDAADWSTYDNETIFLCVKCSKCGLTKYQVLKREICDYKYCPNCGAKMDEMEGD